MPPSTIQMLSFTSKITQKSDGFVALIECTGCECKVQTTKAHIDKSSLCNCEMLQKWVSLSQNFLACNSAGKQCGLMVSLHSIQMGEKWGVRRDGRDCNTTWEYRWPANAILYAQFIQKRTNVRVCVRKKSIEIGSINGDSHRIVSYRVCVCVL